MRDNLSAYTFRFFLKPLCKYIQQAVAAVHTIRLRGESDLVYLQLWKEI